MRVLLQTGKEYVCVMRLHRILDEETVREIVSKFVGEIYQRPPLRSSVKRVVRKRTIYYIKDLELQDNNVLFRVGCQAGTYIRKLCFDAGELMGSGAHMVELRRTRAGAFKEEDLFSLYDLSHAYSLWKDEENEEYLREIVKPVESAFQVTPKIYVRDSAVDALCHGADLAVPGILKLHSGIKPNNIIGLFTQKGEIICLATALMSSKQMIEKNHGIAAKIERVMMATGTYSSLWKKNKLKEKDRTKD
jgi:H/ACA ribonucleoprotein complex subunit 4